MSDNDHWHYVSDIHGGAEEHHRHHDLENAGEAAQRDIRGLREDVRQLRARLDNALDRIGDLENSTPDARQAQYETDVALADLAESGFDEHYGEPEDDEPGQS